MDSFVAIGVGLGLRAVIDALSHNSVRVGPSLIGVWEGAVLHHFLAKFPYSIDPFVGFGFRLLVDLLFTESLTRLTIVLLWTGLGMLLSDVGSELWTDKRFRRLWRRIRHTLSAIAPFSQTSRARFIAVPHTAAPSRPPPNPTATSPRSYTPSQPSVSPPQIRSQLRSTSFQTLAAPRRPATVHVPGSFSDLWSETDTDAARDVRQPPPPPHDTPSELEYVSLPAVPIAPRSYEPQPPSESGNEDERYDRSGLTTPKDRGGTRSLMSPHDESGLTTPVLNQPHTLPTMPTPQEPPLIEIMDVGDDDNGTPTVSPSELPALPIRLSTFGADEQDTSQLITFPEPHISSFEPPEPSPGLAAPPMHDIPNIPTPDDRPEAKRGDSIGFVADPVPPYPGPYGGGDGQDVAGQGEANPIAQDAAQTATEPIAQDAAPAVPEVVAPAADESADRPPDVPAKVKADRSKARAEEKRAASLERERKEAKQEGDVWTAFRKKVEKDEAEKKSAEWHKKAKEKILAANSSDEVLSAVGMAFDEGMAYMEQALRDSLNSGSSELRVKVTKSKKKQFSDAWKKRHSIDTEGDADSLVIKLPGRPST